MTPNFKILKNFFGKEIPKLVSAEEITRNLLEFQKRVNVNPILKKMLKKWSRIIHLKSSDTGAIHTLKVVNGQLVEELFSPSFLSFFPC